MQHVVLTAFQQLLSGIVIGALLAYLNGVQIPNAVFTAQRN